MDFRKRLLAGYSSTTTRAKQENNFHSYKDEKLAAPQNLEIFRTEPLPPIKSGDRGLVISAPVQVDGTSISTRGALNSEELRHNLLFWDKLDYPKNNFIEIGGGSELDFLIGEGVIQRTSIAIRGGGSGGEIIRRSHVKAFNELDAESPGQWALGRGINSVAFRDGDTIEGRALLFDLHSAIPIPSKEVALQDVLDFKQRRNSELLQLRFALDKIYQDILSAPDKPLAESSAISDLDRAIANHLKVSREAKFPLKLSGIKAKLDWKAVVAAGVTFNASVAHFPLVNTLLLSAGAVAAASLSIEAGVIAGRDRKTPFEYIIQIERELG
jgi:hypothetical protein